MFDLIVTLFPWLAWAALAAAILVVAYVLFGWKGVTGAFVSLLPVLGLLYGRKLEADAQRAKRDREALRHVETRNRINDDIADLGAQDVDENLARWNRDQN